MKPRTHRTALIGTALLALVGALVFSSAAAAARSIQVVEPSANQSCSALAAAYAPGETWTELKFDPYANGTKTDGTVTVTVSGIDLDAGDRTFSWTADRPVRAVYAKGGGVNSSNLYLYAPDALGDAGGDLQSNHGASHISFCYRQSLVVEKTVTTELTRTYAWDVEKTATPASATVAVGGTTSTQWSIVLTKTGSTDSAWELHSSIEVTNPTSGAVTVSGVADSLPGALLCEVTFPYSLPAGQSIDCTHVAELDGPNGGTNSATATSSTQGVGNGTASATYAFGEGTTVHPVNAQVDLVDSNGHAFANPYSGSTTVNYNEEFTCDEPGEDTTTNTVDVRPHGSSTVLDSDSADFVLNCSEKPKQDLIVSKTADGDWTRNNLWSVTKTHSPAGVSLTNGSSGNVSWLIDVTKTAETYGIVEGTITIENPNDFGVTGVQIVESLAGAEIECELRAQDEQVAQIASESGLSIPAGGILDCTYYALVDSPVVGSYTNTVNVTTDDEEISGEAEDGYSFAAEPSLDINAGITVTDAALEQAWSASNGTNGDRTLPQTFTCSRDAGVHSNTVVLTGDNSETEQVETNVVLGSATDSVTVTCNEPPSTPPSTPPMVTPTVTPAVAPTVTPVVTPQAPFTPPTAPKPTKKPVKKPVVKPAVCTIVSIAKKSLAAGKKATVIVKLTAGGKAVAGARVRLSGAGVNKVVKADKAGIATASITARQSGIITVTVVGKKACSTQRLGVVGTFEPPVTG